MRRSQERLQNVFLTVIDTHHLNGGIAFETRI